MKQQDFVEDMFTKLLKKGAGDPQDINTKQAIGKADNLSEQTCPISEVQVMSEDSKNQAHDTVPGTGGLVDLLGINILEQLSIWKSLPNLQQDTAQGVMENSKKQEDGECERL